MEDELQAIKEAVILAADIVEIIGGTIELTKKGKDWWAPCPFHEDGSPSFSVMPAKRAFYCFGCKKGGNVIDYWMEYHQVKFWDALKAVGDLCGVAVKGGRPPGNYLQYPKQKTQTGWQPVKHDEPSQVWKDKSIKFVIWAYDQLCNNKAAWDYLAGRGIRRETIVAYGLGWCEGEKGGDLYRPRKVWGLPPEYKESGEEKRLWIPKGWVIPDFNEKNDVVKIRIRRADLSFSPDMKYYFFPGGSNETTVLRPERLAFVIVESDLDAVLIAQEAGDLVGVVPLGSVHVKPDEKATSILKKAAHIMNALDFDRAGAQAWPWWQQNFPECERWPVPKGKDPGEAWQKGISIREWIRQGLPPGLR